MLIFYFGLSDLCGYQLFVFYGIVPCVAITSSLVHMASAYNKWNAFSFIYLHSLNDKDILLNAFRIGTGDDMIMYNPLQGCDCRCSSCSSSYGSKHEDNMIKMIVHFVAAS